MKDYQYAGFWIRFAAVLIDTIILLIVIAVPLTLIYGAEYWFSERTVLGVWDILLNYVLPVVATIWFWRKYLGTPGKMALNLSVVDARTGKALTLGQSIGRYFAYFISALPLCLGFIWVAVDSKKQGWHDKLAGSVVIRNKAGTPVSFEAGE
ncbi:MAG: RDD family protein [Pseudohongiella sp.]|nr:RDD family protein [Pseudohongiella sp.]